MRLGVLTFAGLVTCTWSLWTTDSIYGGSLSKRSGSESSSPRSPLNSARGLTDFAVRDCKEKERLEINEYN